MKRRRREKGKGRRESAVGSPVLAKNSVRSILEHTGIFSREKCFGIQLLQNMQQLRLAGKSDSTAATDLPPLSSR